MVRAGVTSSAQITQEDSNMSVSSNRQVSSIIASGNSVLLFWKLILRMSRSMIWQMMLFNIFKKDTMMVSCSSAKYKITQDDIDRGKAPSGGTSGITTTTVDKTVGVSTQFTFQENGNYIPLPDSIIGVNKIYRFPGTQRCQRECSTSNINC